MKKYEDLEKDNYKVNKIKTDIISIIKFVMILIIIGIWYFLINSLKNNLSSTKLIINIYLIIVYMLFNIVLFSILQVNYKVKPKLKKIRKDTKIIIILSKILSILNVVLIIISSYLIYTKNDILLTIVYFLPLCGMDLIFYSLASSLEMAVVKHQKLDFKMIKLAIIFIMIGIIICIFKRVDILKLVQI